MSNNQFKYRQSSPKIDTGTKINVYQNLAHIVEKYSHETKIIVLPNFVNLESIIVIGDSGRVIPFSYIPSIDLSNIVIDKEVEVTKDGNTIIGKVISFDNNDITVMSKNKVIVIRQYDNLILNVDEDVAKPKLVLDNVTSRFTVSYLLNNIKWSCTGTILISTSKNTLQLRLVANITNETEHDISGEVVIVSGKIYQKMKYNDNVTGFSAKLAMSPQPQNIATSSLEDYVKYQIGNKLLRTNNMIELGAVEVPFNKVYIHQLGADVVKFGYRFDAVDYLPSCSVNVYTTDNNSIDSYIGSAELEEKQKHDEIDVIIGETTKLQCVSTIIVTEDSIINTPEEASSYGVTFNKPRDGRGMHLVTEDINVEIMNRNVKKSFLIIKYYIGNKQLVDLRCNSFKHRKNGYLEWYFQIEGNSNKPEKKHFTCQILTAAFY